MSSRRRLTRRKDGRRPAETRPWLGEAASRGARGPSAPPGRACVGQLPRPTAGCRCGSRCPCRGDSRSGPAPPDSRPARVSEPRSRGSPRERSNSVNSPRSCPAAEQPVVLLHRQRGGAGASTGACARRRRCRPRRRSDRGRCAARAARRRRSESPPKVATVPAALDVGAQPAPSAGGSQRSLPANATPGALPSAGPRRAPAPGRWSGRRRAAAVEEAQQRRDLGLEAAAAAGRGRTGG